MATPTIEEAVRAYIRSRTSEKKSPATIQNDDIQLSRFAREMAKQRVQKINSLTPVHVYNYFYGPGGVMSEHSDDYGRTYPPLSESSHNLLRRRLVGFFRYCEMFGWVRNPTLLMANVLPMKLPRRERMRPAPRVLLSLLEAAENPLDRVWLAACMNTALRQSELRTLTIGDVDLDGGWLKVRVYKTKQEDRLPITAEFDKELRAWFEEYADLIGRPLTEEDFLFPHRVAHLFGSYQPVKGVKRPPATFTYHPDKPIKNTEFVVQRALKRIGMDTRYEGTHTIRRGVARALFDELSKEAGYESAIGTVSALLHHSLRSTTEIYLGLSTEKERRDKMMRGRPFLSAMVEPETNVVPLRRVK